MFKSNELSYQSQNHEIGDSKQENLVKMLEQELEDVLEAGVSTDENGEIFHILDQAEKYMKLLESANKKLKETQIQMKSLIEHIPSAVLRYYYNPKKKYAKLLFMSDRIYEMTGYSKEECKNRSAEENGQIIFGRNRSQTFATLDKLIETGCEFKEEGYTQRADGTYIWILMRSSIVAKEEDTYLIQTIVSDITERKESLERIWQEQEKLHVIAELSADLVFEYDIYNDWMYYSNNRVDIIGQEVITEHYSENIIKSGLIYEDDIPAMKQFCQELKEGKPEIKLELRKKYADGIFHWSSIHAKTLYNQEGKPVRIVGTTSNIDERKLGEEKLRRRSERDSLTNLYNHMTIKTLVNERLQGEEKEAWLLIMDVDNFKQVNDKQGHLYGNAVLCSFADELNHVFCSPWIGRIGGDEFCVLAVGETKESICKKMELFNQRIQKMVLSEGNEISISSSIGAAKYQPENYEYDSLFQQADSALYYVKNHGKSGGKIFDPVMCEMDRKEEPRHNDETHPISGGTCSVEEQDLLLFTMDLFECVNNIQNALQVLCDKLCRFFDFDDILMIEEQSEELKIHYFFSRLEEWDGVRKAEGDNPKHLKQICVRKDKENIHIWNQEAMEQLDKNLSGTSLLCISVFQEILPNGYVIFRDRKKEHDWNACKVILSRFANILCSKLNQYEKDKKKEEQLKYAENSDRLTQLPNYTEFLSLSEAYRKDNPDKKFFCTYSDFFNFQYINELYGFSMGNKVLCEFAAALREKCASMVYACRVNADHFIALHQGEDIRTVCQSFEQMTREFCNHISQQYQLSRVMLASGISEVQAKVFDCTCDDFAYDLDNANAARKMAKRKAETCCMEFTKTMKCQIEKQMEITTAMQRSLDNGEFVVYFQPKVALSDETVVGAEALVRWVKEDGTIVQPDDFIPLFEKNGFIKKIDFAVLEQVLCMLKGQLEKGEKIVPIAVNFSRRNQEDADFVDHVMEYLNRYQVPPELIQAEVTESIYLYDLKTLDENMKRLKRSGVTISIDDFGSGYSSLNILPKVSADVIKLDKQFLEENGNEKTTPEFMKYLVKMIKQLGFGIIAEGVETQEQIRMLKEAGCDQVQGYYYARPMPMAEFLEYLGNSSAMQK